MRWYSDRTFWFSWSPLSSPYPAHLFWEVTSAIPLLTCDLNQHRNCLSVAHLRSLLDLWLGISQTKDAAFNRIQLAFGSGQYLLIHNSTSCRVWFSELQSIIRRPHRNQWKFSACSPTFACESWSVEGCGKCLWFQWLWLFEISQPPEACEDPVIESTAGVERGCVALLSPWLGNLT